jgi:hypothetical protein
VQAHALFAQTMGYVALTAALFTAGAWLGRDLTGGVGIVAFIAAFAVLIGLQLAVRRSAQLAVGLLCAFAVGTVCLDAVQYLKYRHGGGTESGPRATSSSPKAACTSRSGSTTPRPWPGT